VTLSRVREQIAFAWGKYVEHAWGHDELRPLSASGSDWYARPMGLTIVDGLDTLLVAGLHDEANAARAWIVSDLDLAVPSNVSTFETNIRVLGGLLSAHALTGDPILLQKAVDVGDRLLPAFDTPTGMPRPEVNLSTGVASGAVSNVAQIGTWILEFGTLSRMSGDTRYVTAARGALAALEASRNPDTGLLGTSYDVDTGAPIVQIAQVGGGVDSWIEYLLKGGLLLGDPALTASYHSVIDAVNEHLTERTNDGLWYGAGDPVSGRLMFPLTGALACFLPGTLTLGGDVVRGTDHGRACDVARRHFGLLPDAFNYRTYGVAAANHDLRPELVESFVYLYRATRDETWRERGREVLETLIARCRVEDGYATLTDVRTGEHGDAMPSFFLAETLKYLYLLFADGATLPLNAWVFNTEAHPLPVFPGPQRIGA